MPYKRRATWRYRRYAKRRRTSYRPRVYRRRFYTRRRKTFRRYLTPYICPSVYKCKLRQSLQIEQTIGTTDSYIGSYACINNVYNPFFIISSGTLTTGLEHLKNLYDKCIVLGCKVRTMITNHTGYILMYDQKASDADEGTPATWNYDYNECPGVKRIMIPSAPAANSTTPGYSISKTSKYYSMRKLKRQALDENDTIEWKQANGPTHEYYWRYWIGHTDGATHPDSVSVRVFVSLTFYCKFSQKNVSLHA